MQRSGNAGRIHTLVSRNAFRALVLCGALILTLLALAAPAPAYKGWQHSTATSKSSCTGGCHAEATPTNATCIRCHTDYKARGAQKCWDCHAPGQSTSSWRLLAGCTATCHVSTRTSGQPSYTIAFTHGAAVHLGASGYGKTCLSCHGVSTGAAAPGASPHHDAVDSAPPTCAGCHNGTIASTPSAHQPYGTDCTSCHTGMDRPTADCSGCHTGRPGSTMPQITYTNTLVCDDAACHGKVTNHTGTPIGAAPCTTCHTAHYQTLGTCQTCHPDPQTFHHGTAAARPLADCAGCHDGGLAAAKTSHSTLACSVCHADMTPAAVPAVCAQCHLPKRFGSATCTACHSPAGLTGREQVHSAMPKAGITCTTCHTGHNADLGACSTCHGLVPEAHHGVATVTSSLLTLSAAPASAAAGTPVVVGGTLTDAGGAAWAGVEVLLQQRRLSQTGFSDLAQVITGADGSFSQTVQPVAGTRYRAVYRGDYSAANAVTVQRPAMAEATLTVAQGVTLTARPGYGARRREGQADRHGGAVDAAARRPAPRGRPARRPQERGALGQGGRGHRRAERQRHLLLDLAPEAGRLLPGEGYRRRLARPAGRREPQDQLQGPLTRPPARAGGPAAPARGGPCSTRAGRFVYTAVRHKWELASTPPCARLVGRQGPSRERRS